MHFASDNIIGVHPNIMRALDKANQGIASSYGNDELSALLTSQLAKLFETDLTVYTVTTGTIANCLSLSALVQPHHFIYCHDHAHINTDECGAPELFTGGAKLKGLPGANGKIDLKQLEQHLAETAYLRPHMNKPGCISISQATECGTVYTLAELKAIADLAKSHSLPIHMDGARFANSLIKLGCSPAEATWQAGIDVLTLGATKNGALAAEAIIFFNNDYAKDFDYKLKRGGQLLSKARFFACQLLAYLDNDLWLQNARHANMMAAKLAALFTSYDLQIAFPVEANEVFVYLPRQLANYLQEQGASFYEWSPLTTNLYRFVTSCFSTDQDINLLAELISSSPK